MAGWRDREGPARSPELARLGDLVAGVRNPLHRLLEVIDDDRGVAEHRHRPVVGVDQVDVRALPREPRDVAAERLGRVDVLEPEQPPEPDHGLHLLGRHFDRDVLEHGSAQPRGLARLGPVREGVDSGHLVAAVSRDVRVGLVDLATGLAVGPVEVKEREHAAVLGGRERLDLELEERPGLLDEGGPELDHPLTARVDRVDPREQARGVELEVGRRLFEDPDEVAAVPGLKGLAVPLDVVGIAHP